MPDDDDFGDDDTWNNLPTNEIEQLEKSAARLTQALPHHPIDHGAAGTERQFVLQNTERQAARFQVSDPSKSHTSSDYGDLEDGPVLDGEIYIAQHEPHTTPNWARQGDHGGQQDIVAQREAWRQQRYGEIYHAPNHASIAQSRQLPQAQKPLKKIQQVPQSLSERLTSSVPSELQDQIDQLKRERSWLQQEVVQANEAVYARAGEIAIVRSNADKLEREFDAKVKLLQAQHASDRQKQKQDLEQLNAEMLKINTEKSFLENDLAEETKQKRKLQKSLTYKNKPEGSPTASVNGDNQATTPKRGRHGLGDGFDNDELIFSSPSKLAMRNRLTPRAGAKKKRKLLEDSPVRNPLELDQSFSFDQSGNVAIHTSSKSDVKSTQDQNFMFVQQVLDHRMIDSQDKSIEALYKFHLPSNPTQSLSSILLAALSPARTSSTSTTLPAFIALEIIQIWADCMKATYYAPIHILMALVAHILNLSPFNTAPDLTNDLMSLLQETADIILIPRCRKQPSRPDSGHISTVACLQLLNAMTSQLACFPDTEESTRIWRTVRFDFVMMLLSFIQPLEELHLILQILQTSILPSSFAMIIPKGDGKQDTSEAHILDNLTRLLVEPPREKQSEASLTAIQLAHLRLAILDLLARMGRSTYASRAMYSHRLLIGRLVRLSNDSLLQAYRYTPAHATLIKLINASMRLLHHFISAFGTQFNLQQKLSVIPGGEKKLLVVLTRLAFSDEGAFLEAGIAEDVMGFAHQMLEDRISPEEAEGLVGVMGVSMPPTARPSRSEDVSMHE